MDNLNEKVRIQLSQKELRILRNLLAIDYYNSKRNIRWEKERIATGEPDSRVYPITLREKHLKFTRHLLKKLSKHVGIKWLYP